jgi:hypothetical protein
MKEHIVIGESPCDEECAQVGSPDYASRSSQELQAFIHQILRVMPPKPDGVVLRVKQCPHDFGAYETVIAEFDSEDAEAIDWAYGVECNQKLENWDDAAKKELGL